MAWNEPKAEFYVYMFVYVWLYVVIYIYNLFMYI